MHQYTIIRSKYGVLVTSDNSNICQGPEDHHKGGHHNLEGYILDYDPHIKPDLLIQIGANLQMYTTQNICI